MTDATFTNARLVLRNEIIDGHLAVRDGKIAGLGTGPTAGEDVDGDFLIPGLIELHTDNIEKNLQPRPGMLWPTPLAAIIAHDTACAGAGITTVYDSVSVGMYADAPGRREFLTVTVESVKQGMARDLFRAEHFLHMRCELPDAAVLDLMETIWDEPLLTLLSLMDHTPGQRQWRDMEKYRVFLTPRLKQGETFEGRVADRVAKGQELAPKHRSAILERWRATGARLPLASHDDTTLDHVAEAKRDGVTIAEFPTTHEAAAALKAANIGVLMGAPNVVRGGSHSGNVSALDLAANGLVDGLSSDYAPFSLLHGGFLLHQNAGMTLPDAIATVTATPARLAGLSDRGAIEEGLRADLVRVRLVDGLPVVRAVWRAGIRVA